MALGETETDTRGLEWAQMGLVGDSGADERGGTCLVGDANLGTPLSKRWRWPQKSLQVP